MSKPIKEKRAKSAKKAYDLNGKPVQYQWKVVMGARGAGKKGAKWGAEEEWDKIKHETVDLRELKHKKKSGEEAYGKDTNGKTDKVSPLESAEEAGKTSGARHYYEGMNYGEQN